MPRSEYSLQGTKTDSYVVSRQWHTLKGEWSLRK